VGCDLTGAQLVFTDECEDLPPPRGGDGFECGLHGSLCKQILT